MKSDGKRLIFVEGESDKLFLDEYLRVLNLQAHHVEACGGKDNLKTHLSTIKNVINSKKVAIIFDADDDLNKAKANIKKQLGDYFDKVEIFLFPNNKECGNLEKLIEKIAIKKEFIDCFKKYLDCIIKQKDQQNGLKNIEKSIIYAYLQACGERDCKKIDFKNENLFDLNCADLRPLKEFLEKL